MMLEWHPVNLNVAHLWGVKNRAQEEKIDTRGKLSVHKIKM